MVWDHFVLSQRTKMKSLVIPNLCLWQSNLLSHHRKTAVSHSCVAIRELSKRESKIKDKSTSTSSFNILQLQSCHMHCSRDAGTGTRAAQTLIRFCQDFVQQIGLLHTTAVVPKQTPHPQLFGCSVVWILW